MIVIRPNTLLFIKGTAHTTELMFLQQRTDTITSIGVLCVSVTSVWILEDNEELIRSV